MIVNTTLTKSQQDKLKKIMKSGTVGKLRLTEVQLKQDSGPHFLKLSQPQTKKVVSSINRNKGVDLATGDFIIFIDGDDFISDDYIEELYNVAV